MNVSIVGCGTVGASLALNLTEKDVLYSLYLYDYDVVSATYDTNEIYPFNDNHVGLNKAELIAIKCSIKNKNMTIKYFKERVCEPLYNNTLVIDCRDNKKPNINSAFSVSLDGYLLYLDATNKNNDDYHTYINKRNPEFILKAMDIIHNYMINSEFIIKELKFYNLQTNCSYILKEDTKINARSSTNKGVT